MSDRTLARRTAIRLYFEDVDITQEMAKYLDALTYTDNEADAADDISISLDDREGTWMNDWLNTRKEKKKTAVVQEAVKVGSVVQFKGGPVYISSTATEATAIREASKCRLTIINSNAHPYHLISLDGGKVYGWCNAGDVGGSVKVLEYQDGGVQEKRAFKGTKIHPMIVQENYNGDGRDKVLDCGIFEIDSVSYSGPPRKVSIKATSIPYSTQLRQTPHNQVWENTTLEVIAKRIAERNKMDLMYLADAGRILKRKEQINTTDIVFLQKLCNDAGISLKVTAGTIVMFDAERFEAKAPVKTITPDNTELMSYSFNTKTADACYTKCHVAYTDPDTKKTIEYTYTRGGAEDGQTLEVKQRVATKEEAMELARKSLRAKNKGETTVSFKLIGNVDYVAGITLEVSGFGEFDGKYIIVTATHSFAGGYTTDIKMRSCLEGY